MRAYNDPYEVKYISEEEFVFDSLTNRELFLIVNNTNIKMMHCINEEDTAWNDIPWDAQEALDYCSNSPGKTVDYNVLTVEKGSLHPDKS